MSIGISIYVYDKTQGPACSIACGPGTAYRNFCVDVRGERGQRRDRQINNLADVSNFLGNEKDRYFQVRNGYVFAEDAGLEALNKILETKDGDEIGQQLRIGVQSDTQVTSCSWGSEEVKDATQTVTQVFGSALSVAYSGNPPHLWSFAQLAAPASEVVDWRF